MSDTSLISRLLREPVLHFLAAGLALYLLAALLRGPELMPEDENLVVVDRDALLNFMQFRANAFDAESFRQALDKLDAAGLRELIDAYVDEEILYREADRLGLEQSDYIIRQRMVDKMRFLLADAVGADSAPDETELQAYLERNRAAYRIAPSLTFTHVYFDASRHGEAEAEALARDALAGLNAAGSGFNEAGGSGDRFPFLRNYVDRTPDYIRSHFGEAFSTALRQLQADPERWQGPLRSEYGWHPVLLTGSSPGRAATLDEVRHELSSDFIAERRQRLLREATATVREQYRVRVDAALREEP